MKFLEAITVTFYDAKNRKLVHDLWIRTSVLNERLALGDDQSVAFRVPKNFLMDLASIPRLMWWFVSPTDWGVLVPAVGHDWLYRNQGKIRVSTYSKDTGKLNEVRDEVFTRKESDRMMLEKMKSFGMSFIKRNLIYLAVRLFGGLSWKK